MSDHSNVRPIKDQAIARVCILSGLQNKLYTQKLIQIEDLERTLSISIKDAEQAIADEKFWGRAKIAMKVVKATMDVTMDVLEAVAVGPAKPVAKGINMIYGRASLVVDGLNGSLTTSKVGQQVVESHVDVLSNSLEYLGKEKAGAVIGGAKTLIKAGQAALEIADDIDDMKSSGVAAARDTCLVQLKRVQEKLAIIRAALSDCETAQS